MNIVNEVDDDLIDFRKDLAKGLTPSFMLRGCPSFQAFITKSKRTLFLSCFHWEFWNGSTKVEGDHDTLFEALECDKYLEELFLETDFINCLPLFLLQCQHLKYLNVNGSRFWDLNLTQVPTSIEYLLLVSQSNLSFRCLQGMERLVHLKELYLCNEWLSLEDLNLDDGSSDIINIDIYQEYESVDSKQQDQKQHTDISESNKDEKDNLRPFPLIDLPKLEKVGWTNDFYVDTDKLERYFHAIRNSLFFRPLQHRIKTIKYNEMTQMTQMFVVDLQQVTIYDQHLHKNDNNNN